ncbi:hypothetical protein F4X86_01045 [Candidatus Saccharibacteria bacterium]|nr:hypothetical protein [Candidatus Saccharibacteria bacterium]
MNFTKLKSKPVLIFFILIVTLLVAILVFSILQPEPDRNEPVSGGVEIELPEGADSLLPDGWSELTAEEKIELNPFVCLHESDISEVDGRCSTAGGIEYIQLLNNNGFGTWFAGQVVMAVPPETSRSQFDDLSAYMKERIAEAHFAFLLDIYSYEDVTYNGTRWELAADNPRMAYELEEGRQILDAYLQSSEYTAEQKVAAMSSYCHVYGFEPGIGRAAEEDAGCVSWKFIASSYYGGCQNEEHSVNDHVCGDLLAYERWSAMEAEIKGDTELRSAHEERLASLSEANEARTDRSAEKREADALNAEMQAIIFTADNELRARHGFATAVFGGPNITAVFIK